MIVILVCLIEHDVEIAAIDTRLLHAAHAYLVALKRQARQRIAQTRLARPQIEQSGGKHIAADAARAIQIQHVAHD